jgi:colanic acid/amylovoran biosynthesis glycosyltransferase
MTSNPRILLVAGGFPLASETFVREQCLQLVERGVDLEILALRPGDGTWSERERAAGIPDRILPANIDRPTWARLSMMPHRFVSRVIRDPASAFGALHPARGWRGASGQLLEIAAAVGRGGRYDAIHCEFGPMGRIMLEVIDAGIIAGPMSVAFYGYDITREIQKHGDQVYEKLFERASILLPNSEYLATRLRDAGAPPERVRVHRLGIRLEDFPFVDRRSRVATPILLAVGGKKGFAHSVRALPLPGDRSVFRAKIIGDGPLRGSLEELARSNGLSDRIEFLGWRSGREVSELMAEADLFVAPSVTAADGDMEGMPLVITEAMASGLPTIGSRHSGIPEVVLDGRNGLVVEERDEKGLAEAIVHFSDHDRRLEAAVVARETAEMTFDSGRQGDELVDLLLSISIRGSKSGK